MDVTKLYLNWLKGNIQQEKIGNVIHLSLPLLDKNNDFIEIYILEENNSYILTDDGETLNELELEGIHLCKKTKKLNQILKSYGVEQEKNELIIRCKFEELALKIHMLALCMIQVSNGF